MEIEKNREEVCKNRVLFSDMLAEETTDDIFLVISKAGYKKVCERSRSPIRSIFILDKSFNSSYRIVTRFIQFPTVLEQ